MTRNQPSYGYGNGPQQPAYTNSRDQYQRQDQYPPVPTYEGVPSSMSDNHNAPYQPSYEHRPSYNASSDYYSPQQESRPFRDNTANNYDPPRYDEAQQSQQQHAQYNSCPSPAPISASPSIQQQQQPPPSNPTDPDRGVMGAVAGGTAGAYAGHKMHHGFLGALGGAFAGHKLEDALKDKKKQKKKDDAAQQYQQQQQQASYNPPAGPPPAYSQHHQQQPPQQQMAGNFSSSSTDVALDRDYDLIARCRAVDGSEKMSALSLNKVLGNSDGSFCWVNEGGNFAASARNVRLVNNGRVLEAELKNVHGQWQHASIWLDEKVGNHDGELTFV